MAGFDAIVVGGGMVGLSAAWHLVQGGARTLLVDAGHAGRATDAGAGILSARHELAAADPFERFAARAVRYYPELIGRLAAAGAGDTGYAVCGSLTVAVSDDEVAPFERLRAGLRRAGRWEGCNELTPEQAQALFPPLARVQGAIHCTRDARVDGRLLAKALREVALMQGLVIRAAEVSHIAIAQGAARSVAIDAEAVPAGHVVIAAGAWSRALGERIGVPVPVAPQRGQIAHLDLAETDTSWPIVRGFRDHYCRGRGGWWSVRRARAPASRRAPRSPASWRCSARRSGWRRACAMPASPRSGSGCARPAPTACPFSARRQVSPTSTSRPGMARSACNWGRFPAR
jgi:D-amino-acid dehydrogenase